MKNGCLWSVKTFLLFDFFFAWHSGFISLMSGPWHAMMIHRRVHRGRLVRNFFHVTIRFFSQYEIRLQKLHKNDQKKKLLLLFLKHAHVTLAVYDVYYEIVVSHYFFTKQLNICCCAFKANWFWSAAKHREIWFNFSFFNYVMSNLIIYLWWIKNWYLRKINEKDQNEN